MPRKKHYKQGRPLQCYPMPKVGLKYPLLALVQPPSFANFPGILSETVKGKKQGFERE